MINIHNSINSLPVELRRMVLQYAETPDYKPSNIVITKYAKDWDNFTYNSIVYSMQIIMESRESKKFGQKTSVACLNLIDFIECELSTKKYDPSINDSIMKTASRVIVEPFLERLLLDKNLRKPLSPSLLNPLPTAALWAFHRYAQTSLDEFDGKFLKATGAGLNPLIETALKERGIDVDRLSDVSSKETILNVLRNEQRQIDDASRQELGRREMQLAPKVHVNHDDLQGRDPRSDEKPSL